MPSEDEYEKPITAKTVWLTICLICLPIVGFQLGWYLREECIKVANLRSRFEKLAYELRLYHEEHGTFPPTKYQPVPGGPIHSWRGLLMPPPGYDFSKNWNSTNNLQASETMHGQHGFKLIDQSCDPEITHYLTIGEGEEWPVARRPLRSLLVKSGKDQFLLVEYPDSKVHWLEPRY